MLYFKGNLKLQKVKILAFPSSCYQDALEGLDTFDGLSQVINISNNLRRIVHYTN